MPNNLPSSQTKGTEPQPFFEQLQQEMERLFDRFRGYPTVSGPALNFGSGLSPAIDVAETEDAIEVNAEIPGVEADHLDVSLNGDVLVIKGEKSDERKEEDKDYHLYERSYGRFHRQIPLGFTPAEDAIEGKFRDGVLRLTVAKPEETKTPSRKIAITTK